MTGERLEPKLLNQDGHIVESDHARRRFLTLGNQGVDGMSEIRGLLDPEARATLDAVLAKWAAPGMCNPDDEQPRVDGQPTPTQARVMCAPKPSATTTH
jgi:hypothetical protein